MQQRGAPSSYTTLYHTKPYSMESGRQCLWAYKYANYCAHSDHANSQQPTTNNQQPADNDNNKEELADLFALPGSQEKLRQRLDRRATSQDVLAESTHGWNIWAWTWNFYGRKLVRRSERTSSLGVSNMLIIFMPYKHSVIWLGKRKTFTVSSCTKTTLSVLEVFKLFRRHRKITFN